MKRDKAIAAMDRLSLAGYTVRLFAIPEMVGWHNPHADEDGRSYRVSIAELGVDKVDVRALLEIADELDLDLGYSPLSGGEFSFQEPDRTPAVVANPRQHPR